MDLIAASYLNIGPFHGESITIHFNEGKYLIKAPIGSGKSFLFFDAPVFALYKHSKRPMLYRKENKGYIVLLFKHDDSYWLIERQIKRTKSGGDSVVSRFYSVSEDAVDIFLSDGKKDIISRGGNIKETLKEGSEEVAFTNQRELESALQDLLPPKEVLLSVNFLLQDANNVFELTPGERISVFKHLFGLLGIDHAKEKLRERRKEVQTTIRIKGDLEQVHKKFSLLLQKMFHLKNEIEQQKKYLPGLADKINLCVRQDFFVDLEMIIETLQIEHFQVEVKRDCFMGIVHDIKQEELQASSLKGKIDQIKQEVEGITKEMYEMREKQKNKIAEYVIVQKEIQRIGKDDFKILQEERILCLKEKTGFEEKLTREVKGLLGDNVHTLSDAVRSIDLLFSEGKQLKGEQDNILLQKKHAAEKIRDREKRKKAIEDQLFFLQEEHKKQTTFHCKKILGDCPYVEMIKGASMKTIKRQKEQFEGEVKEIVEKIAKEKEQYAIDKEFIALQKKMDSLRDILRQVPWKEIQIWYKNAESVGQKLRVLDKKIQEQDAHRLKHEEYVQDQQRLQLEIEHIKEQLFLLEKKKISLEKAKEGYQKKVSAQDASHLKFLETAIGEILLVFQQLEMLVKEHKELQQEVLVLKEEEGVLKNLYTIFSQELLLVVLQEFLPTLEEVMNSYLSQIVSYEVRLHLPVAAGEKIELHIEIVDEKGTRPVRSLSGGQKSVLKLSWILAVSIMMRGKFLFLDETITSLDSLTIAKVADVLEEFVQQQKMKFYVVTHSTQIQDMDIWDGVIELSDV